VDHSQNNGADAVLPWSDQSNFPLDWNGPVGRPFERFPDEAKAQPIAHLLAAVVRRHPDRVALLGEGTSISYAELWREVGGWAEFIAAATAPGELVAVRAAVSAAFPTAMLACLAAGRPFLAMDPDYPPDLIERVLDDARPALRLELDQARVASPGWRPASLAPDEPACVVFTSGSTGAPKGIVNSQRNLLQRVSQSINSAHIGSDDRFLTLTSLSSIVGIRDVLTALLAGACICLIDAQKCGARDILRIIDERRISILFGFPALLRSVVESRQARAGDQLRVVRVGGDTTLWSDIALLRDWMPPGALVQLVYAATEAPMMQWFVGQGAPEDDARIPIGYPLPGNALAVVDEHGAPTRAGQAGELWVRSPYVALGTWTRGRCVADPVPAGAGDDMRIFKTGDLVRRRADGFMDRIGRKDRQVKIRGARVELDGVEASIRRHPAVRDVGVVVRSDDEGARLVAYVEPHDSSPDFLGELEGMMRRTVPPHMRPSRYYATPRIPRLPNSKPDRLALHAMDLAKSLNEEARATRLGESWIERDPVEIIVAHIWRDVLGLPLAAPGDDFFDLGGDSLRAITMTVELEKALGRELPMNLINQSPTFAAFCATLEENAPPVYSPLVVLKPGRGATPVFFIHGVGGGVMELFGIGRKMTWPGPVIGIQARGLDGRDPPHASVQAMTEEYHAAVKARQPRGPYLLCGYSFGGLVAFELARRLSAQGDEVAFVGLLATLPPGHHLLRLWTWTSYLFRQVAQGVAAAKPEQPFAARERRAYDAAPSAVRAVKAAALSASIVYRPGQYGGTLTVFEPGSRDLRLPSSARLWRRHAGALKHYSLQGRHDDMLHGANAAAAAASLTRCLEESLEVPSTDARFASAL
jgi:acyl-coenzyme A synthetase/AMP-(fatty) acid ligase/thioesterase domain-containing protein/acyl carrier protein